ncbi:hypothetical protein BDY24DRAFT_395324 [Mrakia frigida]|uniref:uncharacterized protein n=1 Tax=Mrakia frigida TaxID=29902 RepID=UPI003FCC11F4
MLTTRRRTKTIRMPFARHGLISSLLFLNRRRVSSFPSPLRLLSRLSPSHALPSVLLRTIPLLTYTDISPLTEQQQRRLRDIQHPTPEGSGPRCLRVSLELSSPLPESRYADEVFFFSSHPQRMDSVVRKLRSRSMGIRRSFHVRSRRHLSHGDLNGLLVSFLLCTLSSLNDVYAFLLSSHVLLRSPQSSSLSKNAQRGRKEKGPRVRIERRESREFRRDQQMVCGTIRCLREGKEV